ncbi:hypothetical protein [Lactobacillus plantarum] [Lactiplantibacillus mudanjiangensis]|uniref:ORF6N domain-containing protein n=1 Tax=Lactiplantibacillus mudanjiangensis TaxID=1296538 RepID=UPI001014221A|nr:hypothetical protein [Lactobacillus plantarum] [Lactiplantibacillus mudanjiangensis]
MNDLKVIGEEHIGKYEFTGVEGGFGEGKKAMLVKDIAVIHDQPLSEINRRINDNRKRFKNGVDILDLKQMGLSHLFSQYGFTKAQWGNANNIYLLSERGYSKLLKILEDDKAWEIYDQLVDNYFNMRQSIREEKPELIANKRLDIMEKNAATREANLIFRRAALMVKIAGTVDSKTASQALLANAAKELTGEVTVPIMKQKEYSAGDVGKKLGISANKVGRIANQLGIKAEQPGQNEFGRWSNSKSQHSDKEVPQWLYFDKGVKAINTAMNC